MMLFFVINDLPFLLSHRLPVLLALRDMGLQVAVVAPAHGQSEAQLREAGIAFISWEIDRSSLSLRGELRSVTQLWRIYRRYRPALVQPCDAKAGNLWRYSRSFGQGAKACECHQWSGHGV